MALFSSALRKTIRWSAYTTLLTVHDRQTDLDKIKLFARHVISLETAGSFIKYIWSNQQATSVINVHPPASYWLRGTDARGCTAMDTVIVKMVTYNAPIILDAFSPNVDGFNDKWVIKELENYPYRHVQIFARNGNRIFESFAYKKPWEGGNLPKGTYYFVIGINNRSALLRGWVTLLK